MMKAQCPKCNAIYKVDEKKLPDEGANVICQKCQKHFFIRNEIKPITEFLVDQKSNHLTWVAVFLAIIVSIVGIYYFYHHHMED